MRLTGQDIHAAFVQVHEDPARPPLIEEMGRWERLTERSQILYTRMAEAINERLRQQEKQEEAA